MRRSDVCAIQRLLPSMNEQILNGKLHVLIILRKRNKMEKHEIVEV